MSLQELLRNIKYYLFYIRFILICLHITKIKVFDKKLYIIYWDDELIFSIFCEKIQKLRRKGVVDREFCFQRDSKTNIQKRRHHNTHLGSILILFLDEIRHFYV
jgi:hypothetical protein